MNADKQQLLTSYITHLYTTGRSYDYIGRYIKAVKDFIDKSDDINRKGYAKYKREYAYDLIREPLAKDAICDFLNMQGCGFRKKTNTKNVKPLEKLSTISDRNKNLMNEFIEFLSQQHDYSPHTLDLYSFSVKKYFEYANEISMENYKRFIKMLEKEGFSPKTIRLRITALERLSEYVKKPIKLKRPKFTRQLNTENVPTEDEYNTILQYLKTQKNQDYYFFIKILATTGARISEFLQFKWEDIVNGEVVLKGKGNKYRRFFFSKPLQKEVGEYLKITSKSGFIAVGRYGRLSSRGFDNHLKSWANRCGVDRSKMHAHAFRHFFAKMFLKKNNDIIQLADLLGHGNIETTRIYLQKSYDEQKRDFNKNVTW